MNRAINFILKFIWISAFALLAFANVTLANPVIRVGHGSNAAAIQATVNQFRADLGTNNGVGGSYVAGRREINWDDVPDALAAPNTLPADYFNNASPRGILLSSGASLTNGVADQQPFEVSASTASAFPRFANLDPSYAAIFQTFSGQRLFTAIGSNVVDVEFYIPGTHIPATVSGFGTIFCDVENAPGANIQLFDQNGRTLGIWAAQDHTHGLSFIGVSFPDQRISRVRIYAGNAIAANGHVDGVNGQDVVVMDDFIYGEPRARESHEGDFDGDGTADLAVFRPANGGWYILNSGSGTVTGNMFGMPGDIPVSADFDGDSRIDFTVFRPSTGTWYRQNTSDNTVAIENFGLTGDKPIAADYDKDGKADVGVWRPSSGDYYVHRSSDNTVKIDHWGQNGDIPLTSAGQ